MNERCSILGRGRDFSLHNNYVQTGSEVTQLPVQLALEGYFPGGKSADARI